MITNDSKYNNIRDHMKAAHPKAEYFNCTKCGYKSQLKYLLDRHFYYVHSETNVFKCHMCDYSGNNVAALTKHVKDEHDKMNPFKCSKCSFRCPEEHILAAHTAKSHVKQEVKAPTEKLPDLSKWLGSRGKPNQWRRGPHSGTKAADVPLDGERPRRGRGGARPGAGRKRKSLKERSGVLLPEDHAQNLEVVKAEYLAPASPSNRRFDPPDPSDCIKTELNPENEDVGDYDDQDPDYAPQEENNIDWRDLVHPSAEFNAVSRRPLRKNHIGGAPLSNQEQKSPSSEDALAKEITAAILEARAQEPITPSLDGREECKRRRSRLLAAAKQRCLEVLENACLLCDFVSVGGVSGALDRHIEAVHVSERSPSLTENGDYVGQVDHSAKESDPTLMEVTENHKHIELQNGEQTNSDNTSFKTL